MKRALVIAGLCACARSPASLESHRALEVAVAQDADTIDPRFVVDAVGMRVSRLVHAGLFRLDPNTLEPLPYLAASYRFEDPLTLHVTLRGDVRFHSGASFTSRDVVATIDALLDKSLHARAAHVVSAIRSVEAQGDREVTFHLAHAHATLITDLEVPILRADEAHDVSIDGAALDGLGPYRVARANHPVREGEIDLEPADFGALPKPAHAIVVRSVHDENARALRLIGGETDIAPSGISPSLLPALEARGLRVASRPGANLVYVLFRTDRGPFADRDARRAFGLAIDRARIVKAMLDGHARLATGLLPEGHWAYTARDVTPRDVTKAREFLHGMHAKCTLLGSTDRLRVAIARVVAQDLAEAGIEAELVPLELGTLLSRLNGGDFDAAILQIPELAEPNTLSVFLHSDSIPPYGANRARVHDEMIDTLLFKGDSTLDLGARRAAYSALEDRVRDEAYWIPLWHEDAIAVTSATDAAKDFTLSAEGRWLGLAALR